MAVSAAPLAQMTAELNAALYDHDPGADTATLLGGGTPIVVDMLGHSTLLVIAMTTISGAGQGIQLLEIVAATDAAITTPVVVRAHAATVADATGDYVVLEITDADLNVTGTDNLRYACARLTMDDATDEACVAYIAKPKRPMTGLTATTIA